MPLRPRALAAMAHADLLERARRPSFMVTLGFALWGATIFSPPNGTAYATLQIGGHRGVYNSAWIGASSAILCALFFSIAGFYVTRSAVEHDRRTGVGAILATTPMSRVEYTLAKWLSNFVLLVTMVAVVAVGAAAMQIARGEERHLEPLGILGPFVWVVLPTMAITAGLAVLFETTPVLRGGAGNAIFLFTWMPALTVAQSQLHSQNPWWDITGLNFLLGDMIRAAGAHFPEVRAHPDHYSMGFNFRTGGWQFTTFHWEGVSWTPVVMASRLVWAGVGPALACVAALPFDRFAGELGQGTRRPIAPKSVATVANARIEAAPGAPTDRTLPAVRATSGLAALRGLIAAELRLVFKGLPRIWYVVPLGLVIASAFVPRAVAGRVAAIAWVWPVLQWSALGVRDRRNGTEALLLSAPNPITRPLAAAWLAGFALAFAMGSGLAVRALLLGDVATVLEIASGAAFVPAMALALGTWTGSSKAFEVLYLVLWYGGPLNGIPFLDFSGGSGAGPAAGFAISAAVLLTLAAAGRQRRLMN